MTTQPYDYIVIGSGIAGLYSALLAVEHGSVLILTKGGIADCNTQYAQGGIAAAVGPEDSPNYHLADTLAAGAGLCNEDAARILAEQGPQAISELVRLGVIFDTADGEVALGREAAHRMPRVLHAGRRRHWRSHRADLVVAGAPLSHQRAGVRHDDAAAAG